MSIIINGNTIASGKNYVAGDNISITQDASGNFVISSTGGGGGGGDIGLDNYTVDDTTKVIVFEGEQEGDITSGLGFNVTSDLGEASTGTVTWSFPLTATFEKNNETVSTQNNYLLTDQSINAGTGIVLSKSNGQLTLSASQSLLNKQDALTFDTTPTQSSTNPVTSGGIYTALSGKMNTKTIDETPTSESTNLVSSGGVYSALALKQDTLTAGDNITISGGVISATSTIDISNYYTKDVTDKKLAEKQPKLNLVSGTNISFTKTSELANIVLFLGKWNTDAYVTIPGATNYTSGDKFRLVSNIDVTRPFEIQVPFVTSETPYDFKLNLEFTEHTFSARWWSTSSNRRYVEFLLDGTSLWSSSYYTTSSSPFKMSYNGSIVTLFDYSSRGTREINLSSYGKTALVSLDITTLTSETNPDINTVVVKECSSETYTIDDSIIATLATSSDITEINGALSNKQNLLTFDNAPTENSVNPVKSGGIYTALAGKQNVLIAGNNVTIENDTISVEVDPEDIDLSGYYDAETVDGLLDDKQDVLTAGTGIDITNNTISATIGASWGNITGTLSDQTDLQTILTNLTNRIVALETALAGVSQRLDEINGEEI